jgi:hypothetical protein
MNGHLGCWRLSQVSALGVIDLLKSGSSAFSSSLQRCSAHIHAKRVLTVPSIGSQKDQSGGTERCHNRRTLTISIVEVTEIESGLGQEAVEEVSPVLHPPAPGLHLCGQLADVVLDDIGQRPSQVRPGRLHRIQLAGVWRELVDVSARTGRRSARACASSPSLSTSPIRIGGFTHMSLRQPARRMALPSCS